jgi:uncharacterized protein DUF397
MEGYLARASWRKSSYSGQSSNCIEVADGLPGGIGVRDSKDPGGPALVITPSSWRHFTAAVKNGEFDHE